MHVLEKRPYSGPTIALLALVLVGSVYYIVQRWQDPFQPGNLALLFSWYVGIAFALYFIRKGARLGALVAGIIGWVTMTFWLIEGQGSFLAASHSDMLLGPIALSLNVLGLVTVSIEIAASHNIFHKLRTAVK